MTTKPGRYQAYMLRLWQVADEGITTWRASLESPHTGERHGFASLKALFVFLEKETSSEKRPDPLETVGGGSHETQQV